MAKNNGQKVKNKSKKCFQNALSVALNYEQIKDHPEIKTFTDNYNWNEIDFPSDGKD